MADSTGRDKGRSLSRGPALLVGSLLLAFGLVALIKHNEFPAFGAHFPDAKMKGGKFLGIEVNGWTNWLAIAAGGLLLFGAAQHALAKTMSLIVGLVLAACAVIALVDGDILGVGAANVWTVIGFGAAAIALLINTVLPRIGGDKDDEDDEDDRDRYDRRVRERQARERTVDGEAGSSRPGAVSINRDRK